MTITPGQRAYEQDLMLHPRYHDGSPRPPWHALPWSSQTDWEHIQTLYDDNILAQKLLVANLLAALVTIARGQKSNGKPLGGEVSRQIARRTLVELEFDWSASVTRAESEKR